MSLPAQVGATDGRFIDQQLHSAPPAAFAQVMGSSPQATFGSVPSMSTSGQQFSQPLSGPLSVNAVPPPTVPTAGFGSPVGTLIGGSPGFGSSPVGTVVASPEAPQEVLGGYPTNSFQGTAPTPLLSNTFGSSPVGSLVVPAAGQSQVGSLTAPLTTAGYSPVGSLDVLPPGAVPMLNPSMGTPQVQSAPVFSSLSPSMGAPPVQTAPFVPSMGVAPVQTAPLEPMASRPFYPSMGTSPVENLPTLQSAPVQTQLNPSMGVPPVETAPVLPSMGAPSPVQPLVPPAPSMPFYPSMGGPPTQSGPEFQTAPMAPMQTFNAIPEEGQVKEVIKEVPVPQVVEVPHVVEKIIERVIEVPVKKAKKTKKVNNEKRHGDSSGSSSEDEKKAMGAAGMTAQARPKVVEVPFQRKAKQAPLVPMKDLEGRVINIASFMMFSLCFLPVMGAIACLCDRHYVFWMGCFWPTAVIAGCVFVFVTFVVTIHVLSIYAAPEHRSQFTMAFTWATFVALLGIILVPISLMANKYAAHVAGTVSMGCLSTLPQSELLADYSQVLYNIRLSSSCANERSVTECAGWSRNWYTDYLEYLEYDMQCGPLCPEQPPPASAIVAPSLDSTPLPDVHPHYEPPLFGPPMQGIRSFLQAESETSQEVTSVHRHHHKASGVQQEQFNPNAANGIMEHALPHVQAKRLFDSGTTRMTCFPLIATRLQVLLQTFGGLWYLEGMGLIIISFFTSLYTGCYFAFSKSATPV